MFLTHSKSNVPLEIYLLPFAPQAGRYIWCHFLPTITRVKTVAHNTWHHLLMPGPLSFLWAQPCSTGVPRNHWLQFAVPASDVLKRMPVSKFHLNYIMFLAKPIFSALFTWQATLRNYSSKSLIAAGRHGQCKVCRWLNSKKTTSMGQNYRRATSQGTGNRSDYVMESNSLFSDYFWSWRKGHWKIGNSTVFIPLWEKMSKKPQLLYIKKQNGYMATLKHRGG